MLGFVRRVAGPVSFGLRSASSRQSNLLQRNLRCFSQGLPDLADDAGQKQDSSSSSSSSDDELGELDAEVDAELQAEPDAFNPAELPVDGQLNDIYVTDTDTLESRELNISPEDDRTDKTIAWEDFDRGDMYKLLKHAEDAKSYGPTEYMNSYAQMGSALSKDDLQYVHHMQTDQREIANISDDEVGFRMANNRHARMQFQENDVVSLEAWAKEHLGEELYAEKRAEIEAAGAEVREIRAKRIAKGKLRRVPQIDHTEYKKRIANMHDPKIDDLYPDPEVPYTYEDWENELRRNYVLRNLPTKELPEMAKKALDITHEAAKIPSLLSPAQELAQYKEEVLEGDTKPVKEYHQRMLRLHGNNYELGEVYVPPAGPLDAEMEGLLEARIATADAWTDPPVDPLLADVDADGEEGMQGGRAEYDEDIYEEVFDDSKEERRLAALDFKRRKREALRQRKLKQQADEASLSKYMELIEALDMPGERDTDPTNEKDVAAALVSGGEGGGGPEDEALGTLDHTDSDPDQDEDGNFLQPEDKVDRIPEGLDFLMLKHKEAVGLSEHESTGVDPRYDHLDKNELTMLKAMDPGLKHIANLCNIPDPLEGPRVFYVPYEVKDALYRLNKLDANLYHSRKLASMFGLSVVRTQAILTLMWYEEHEYGKEVMDGQERFDNAFMEHEHAEYFKPEAAQWDPERFFENLKTEGKRGFADEGELASLLKIEKLRNSGYWNLREDQILKEKALKKPYGEPAPGLPPPSLLRAQDKGTNNKKIRHTVVLCDTSGKKKGNYRIAVKDKSGALREPNNEEFLKVRGGPYAKTFFNHVPYKYNEKI